MLKNSLLRHLRFIPKTLSVRRQHILPPEVMDLKAVTEVLEGIAPTANAESWDNVGLLLEPSNSSQISRLLITNDLTEEVLEEAVKAPEGKSDLVVSYHPPLFVPFKRLTQHSGIERVIVRAIEERIAIYSPHTSLDNMEGGINDWLLSCVGEGKVRALGVVKHPGQFSNLLHLRGPDEDRKVVEVMLNQQYGVGEISSSPNGLDVECTDAALATIYPVINPSHTISVSSNSKILPTLSGGKLLTLEQPTPLSEIVKRIKAQLKLEHIRLAKPYNNSSGEDPIIRTVGACAGSGGRVLAGVQANLLLTGEMSHHQVLEATSRGAAVILCEHTNTERGFLQGVYKQRLEEALGGQVAVTVATTDKDPLSIV